MAIGDSRVLTPDRSARDLFGSEVRRYRTNAGMSLTQLADVLKYSKTHLGNIETADRVIPPGLADALDAAFGTDGHFARLYALAKKEAHPGKYRRFMALEAEAVAIGVYGGQMIPGLLQTEAYARCLLRAGHPTASDDEIDQLVTARLARQERLRANDGPFFTSVIDESALRRPVGGPKVMADQLSAILRLIDTPRTVIQVLPFEHGEHALMAGLMTLLRLPDRTTVVYAEGVEFGQVIEEFEDVERRQRAYDYVRACALSPRESAAFITSVLEGYCRCEQSLGARVHSATPPVESASK